jgi:hypothetical protein
MTQMEDSASDTTRDDIDTQTCSISSEDLCLLKQQVAAPEADVQAIDTHGSHPNPSTILQTVSDLKDSLEKVVPTSLIL